MTRRPRVTTVEEADAAMEEYLRRNLLHAAAVGAEANARAALQRLLETKRPRKWLVEALDGIATRANRVAKEMAAHRNEIEIGHIIRKKDS